MNIYTPNNIFYVYAYLRSKDSITASKGTPYYIGKGSNGRAYKNHGPVPLPSNKSNIVFLERQLSENKAFEIEKFLIAYHGRKDIGTGILLNRSEGGNGPSGRIASDETRAKMSITKKGRTFSEEHKAKISVALKGKRRPKATIIKISIAMSGENHPNYGKHHSEETKALMSAAQSGETHHMYGKHLSDGVKVKLSIAKSGENSPWYGKHLSDEHKIKISSTKKNRPIVECPHCSKQGKGPNMVRYHFNNCKLLACASGFNVG